MELPLNVAVIGCGALAQGAHLPTISQSARMRLHTCCDLSDANLAVCRDKFGARHLSKDFSAVIRDPEVQVICLAATEKLRLPVIALAAELGKPVYCEKPLAKTLTELYQIQEVVNESGIPFCVGHNRRSSPAMLAAHALFRAHMTQPQPCPWRWNREGAERPALAADGVAGMAVRVNDDWWSWKKWVFDPEQAPEGPMLFEMTHFTDMCNWFLAAEPEEVMALESGMLHHGVAIRYRTGELATIAMCANGTFGYPKELYEMMGNGGLVVVDHMVEVRTAGIAGAPDRQVFPMVNDRHPQVGQEGGLYGWLAKKRAACAEAVAKRDPLLIFTGEANKGHVSQFERFVDQILGQGPEVCGVDAAVDATRVAFAAIRSAKERRVVKLAEI
jgi:predicted dehydrogenase